METIRDFFQAGNEKASVSAVVGLSGRYGRPSKRWMKYFMPKTPEI
jgi:hypothetical protein